MVQFLMTFKNDTVINVMMLVHSAVVLNLPTTTSITKG